MRICLAFILLIFTFHANAQGVQKYFGYYYDDANNSFNENYDHTNLYHIDTFIIANNTVDRDATAQYMLGEMAKAKARGVHVIITAAPFVFYFTDSTKNWSNEPNAQALWSQLVDQMVNSGYLVPGSPQTSTVVAIYLVDEPNLNHLADTGQSANPALINAVTAIRNDGRTSSIPIAANLEEDFATNFSHGLRYLDWVGFDAYNDNQSQWASKYNDLKNLLSPAQRTILVPKAATGSAVGTAPNSDPDTFYNIMKNDSKVIWLSPFTWFSTNNFTGTRDIPALRSAYTRIGLEIKTAGCQSSPTEQAYCLGSAKRAAVISAITSLLLQ